jgi:hypothetical protein
MARNVPLFECPDKDIEEIYHFRWWTFRKHIKETPDGFVITEFLPKVNWSGKHNTISCPAGHHFREGRWIRDPEYLDDYAVFWFRKGGSSRAATASGRPMPSTNARWPSATSARATGPAARPRRQLRGLGEVAPRAGRPVLADRRPRRHGGLRRRQGHRGRETRDDQRLHVRRCAGDRGHRRAGRQAGDRRAYRRKGRNGSSSSSWRSSGTTEAKFFKVLPRGERAAWSTCANCTGTRPGISTCRPERGLRGRVEAADGSQGLLRPVRPDHRRAAPPRVHGLLQGHECQWNGPSWPFATSVTLTALANVLNDYPQQAVSRKDYFETLKIYTKSHRLKRDDGPVVPWIDENLNPTRATGLPRTRLKAWKERTPGIRARAVWNEARTTTTPPTAT